MRTCNRLRSSAEEGHSALSDDTRSTSTAFDSYGGQIADGDVEKGGALGACAPGGTRVYARPTTLSSLAVRWVKETTLLHPVFVADMFMATCTRSRGDFLRWQSASSNSFCCRSVFIWDTAWIHTAAPFGLACEFWLLALVIGFVMVSVAHHRRVHHMDKRPFSGLMKAFGTGGSPLSCISFFLVVFGCGLTARMPCFFKQRSVSCLARVGPSWHSPEWYGRQ